MIYRTPIGTSTIGPYGRLYGCGIKDFWWARIIHNAFYRRHPTFCILDLFIIRDSTCQCGFALWSHLSNVSVNSPFSMLSRRHAKLFLETFMKIRQASKPYAVRNLSYVVTVLRQQLRRALQSDSPKELAGRLVRQGFDFPVKIHTAAASFTTQFINGKMLIIHMLFDDGQYFYEKFFVKRRNGDLFGFKCDLSTESLAHPTPLLDPVANDQPQLFAVKRF
jgi:hypothetical protein